MWLGTDTSWDLRNYHIYNAFAALNGRVGTDIAPAQVQSYYLPWVDVLHYWLRGALNEKPALLAFVLAFPSALATLLAVMIARRVIPGEGTEKAVLVAAAVAFGATGAAGLPTTGSAMSEMAAGSFTLAGLLLLIGALRDLRRAIPLLAGGGALLGVGAALKLTTGPFALGALLALAVAQDQPWPVRLRRTLWTACWLAAAALAVGGLWWWTIYRHFGNPLFPAFNEIFRSPFYFAASANDRRFMPAGVIEALFYPFAWGFGWRHPAYEVTLRDLRFAIVYLAILGWLVARLLPRSSPRSFFGGNRAALFLVVFFAASFVLWEAQFSILRYLAPVELLVGVVIVLVVTDAVGSAQRLLRNAMLAAAALLVVRATTYPDWGHAPIAAKALDVSLPGLPQGAIVLLLDKEPLGYLAAAEGAQPARFLGANSNLIEPGDANQISLQLDAVVRDASGPVFGIESSMAPFGQADTTLAHHRLRRSGECSAITSNLEDPRGHLQICRLERLQEISESAALETAEQGVKR